MIEFLPVRQAGRSTQKPVLLTARCLLHAFGVMFLSIPLLQAQTNHLEQLRTQITEKCVIVISDLYELADLKEEMSSDAIDYCECLYSAVIKEDWDRLYRKELRVPELIHLKYKELQRSCAANYLLMGKSSMETKDSELPSALFWTGKLIDHYLLTYKQNTEVNFLTLKECFEPKFNTQYIPVMDSWANKELPSAEIFDQVPQIKKDLEDCFATQYPETAVVFRIQIAAGEEGRRFNNLDDLGSIKTQAVPNRSIVRYQLGDFESKEKARSVLSQVKLRGYPDAFIIKE